MSPTPGTPTHDPVEILAQMAQLHSAFSHHDYFQRMQKALSGILGRTRFSLIELRGETEDGVRLAARLDCNRVTR